MRKSLPDTLIGPALRDDVNAVVPFFRAAPDRLYLREQNTGRTIFHLACLSPKAALLRELVDGLVTDKQSFSLDEVDYDGCHPCHLCARQGHLEHLDILVRCHTSPTDGQPTFPHPLVDNHGRSVANYTKDPVEWTSYGAAFAQVFTRPIGAITPTQFGIDDIVNILSLKRSFAATPLPWLMLPACTEMASASTLPLSLGSPSRSSSPIAAAAIKAKESGGRVRGLLESSIQSTVSGALQLATFDDDATVLTPIAEKLVLVVPSQHTEVVATGPSTAMIVPHPPPPPASLNASMLGQSTKQQMLAEPEAFGVLLVTKDPVYVAEMILIKKEIQFESEIFYHDTDISGTITLRGIAIQVDYYRPTRDPDVILSAWRCVANPEVILYLCKRVAKPPPESNTRKQKIKRALNALEASLEIFSRANKFSRQQQNSKSTTQSATTPSAGALDASIRIPVNGVTEVTILPTDGAGESPAGVVAPSVTDVVVLEETTAPAEDAHTVVSDDDEDLIPYTVTEAADIILVTLRQRLWGLLRTSVRDAIRKVYIVKRFVRRVVNLRSRCVNLFFARLLPVLDAVRTLLATRKRILIQEQLVAESRYLALNIPSVAAHACVRRCAKRKDHRWAVNAHDVFLAIAPLVVGAPDIQATLVRLLTDEWLVPTAERERLSALSVATGSPTKSQRSAQSPRRRAAALAAATNTRRKRDSNDVIRCSPHSPIPYLVGSGSELRAMLVSYKQHS